MSTFRHQLANIVSVPLSMCGLLFMKIFYPQNIYFSGIERFSPSVVIDVDRKSKIRFGKRISIHSRGRFVSKCGGELDIGNNTSFNIGCIVVCRKKISVGKNVSFGPNVVIYDHDHIMSPVCGAKGPGFNLGDIIIEDNVWIGAGSIILSGAHIGRNCVIAAGSVVKGRIPDNTVLIQKRVNTYKEVE